MNDRLHRRLDTWDVDDSKDYGRNSHHEISFNNYSHSLFSGNRQIDTSLSTPSVDPGSCSSSSTQFRYPLGSSTFGQGHSHNHVDFRQKNLLHHNSRDMGRMRISQDRHTHNNLPSRGGSAHMTTEHIPPHQGHSRPIWPAEYSRVPWQSDWAISQGQTYSLKKRKTIEEISKSSNNLPIAPDTSGYDSSWSKHWSNGEELQNSNLDSGPRRHTLPIDYEHDVPSNSEVIYFQSPKGPNSCSRSKTSARLTHPDHLLSLPVRQQNGPKRYHHLQENPTTQKVGASEFYISGYPDYQNKAGDRGDLYGSRTAVPIPGSFISSNRNLSKRESPSSNFDELILTTKTGIVHDSKCSTHLSNGVTQKGHSAKKKEKVNSKKRKNSSNNVQSCNTSLQKSQFNVPEVFTFQTEADFKNVYNYKLPRDMNYDVVGDLREESDEKQGRRKRNHVMFLLVVLFIVAVAVVSAVLAATLGNSRERLPSDRVQEYAVVRANMTLKILNRIFTSDLLTSGSAAFHELAIPYSIELDVLFLRSGLSSVYSRNEILSFRNGSIYATSSITFADSGLITSPKDVENVIESADSALDPITPDALRLGEFVVCRSCAETKVEYITVTEKPEIMLHSLETTTQKVTATDQVNTTISSLSTDSYSTSASSLPTTQVATQSELSTSTFIATFSTNTPASETSSVAVTTALDFPTTTTKLPTDVPTTSTSEVSTASTTMELISSTTEESLSSTKEMITSSTTTSIKVDTTSSPNYPTVITVANISAVSTSNYVIVTCFITNPNYWSAVDVVLIPSAVNLTSGQAPQTILRLDPRGNTTFGKMYANRTRAEHKKSQDLIDVRVNITNLSCYDDGFIECSLVGRSGSRTFGRGRLEVIEPPSLPTLVMPMDVVANVEMTFPIICHAQTGYPNWNLRMTAQVPGESTFHLMHAEREEIVDGCRFTVILRLRSYTPTFASNGTRFRCELEKKGDMKFDTGELLVVGGSVCKGQPDNTKLRHPYNCSFYLVCKGHQPKVYSCPSDQCFDTVSGQCGLKSVIVESTNGFLNDGLASITCSVIHVSDWSKIIIEREDSPTQFTEVVSVAAPNGTIKWHDVFVTSRAVASTRVTTREVVLEMWLYVLKCSDEAVYRCSVLGPTHVKDGTTELKVYEKPESPTLTVPRSVVEGSGETASITCEATLGRPPATMTLMRKLPNQSTFLPVNFSETGPVQPSGCTNELKREYTISAAQEVNGSMFRCDVNSSSDVHEQVYLASDEQEFYVLKAKTCQGVDPTLLVHPKDCRYFVQCVNFETTVLSCVSGSCFNSRTQQCDIITPTTSPFTADEECYPDKDNITLAHPALCNKYIRCDRGRAVIQHCPEEHLYSKDGACSKNIYQSFCYNKMNA